MDIWYVEASEHLDIGVQLVELHTPQFEEDFVHQWFSRGKAFYTARGDLKPNSHLVQNRIAVSTVGTKRWYRWKLTNPELEDSLNKILRETVETPDDVPRIPPT